MGERTVASGPALGLAAARWIVDVRVVSASDALSVRYPRCPFRVDAGIIPSPLGLATLEMRPDLNPTVAPPFYYVVPLPRFDQTFDALQVISGGYPLGAMVSTSGTHWDARGGVTNSTPARGARRDEGRSAGGDAPADHRRRSVTPIPGLRVGGGFGHGRYRDPRTDDRDHPVGLRHAFRSTASGRSRFLPPTPRSPTSRLNTRSATRG